MLQISPLPCSRNGVRSLLSYLPGPAGREKAPEGAPGVSCLWMFTSDFPVLLSLLMGPGLEMQIRIGTCSGEVALSFLAFPGPNLMKVRHRVPEQHPQKHACVGTSAQGWLSVMLAVELNASRLRMPLMEGGVPLPKASASRTASLLCGACLRMLTQG